MEKLFPTQSSLGQEDAHFGAESSQKCQDMAAKAITVVVAPIDFTRLWSGWKQELLEIVLYVGSRQQGVGGRAAVALLHEEVLQNGLRAHRALIEVGPDDSRNCKEVSFGGTKVL